MALKLKGSTSGFVGLDAPSVAGNNTLILPENSGSAFQLFANDITAGVTTFTTVTVNRNGDLTVPGTISIGGTLTYEDVTSVDSIGIVTARGLSIFGNTTGLNVTGVSTFGGDVSIADKIVHTADENTVIRFPAADTITAETAGSERLRITSTGLIGIGTDNPLSGAAGARVNIYFEDQTTYDSTTNRANGLIINNQASGGYSSLELAQRTTSGNTYGSAIINAVDPQDGNTYGADLTFQTRATGSGNYGERMRITAAGQILLGTATARAVGGESNPRLHIEGTGNTSNSWFNLTRFQAGTGASNIQFGKARSNTAGTYTIVQDDDKLGQISFLGADGTDLANYAAKIESFVDGTPANNNIPGRLTFSTASGGTMYERLRITSTGLVRIGASTDEDVHTGEGADLQVVSTDGGGITLARDDTTVSNGANLGVIRAYGNDNNGTYQEVASIQFQADKNHGNNDKPGRIVFSTTADGGSSVTERLRITSDGQMGLGTNNPVQQAGLGLHINGTDQARLKLTNTSSGATANDGFDIIIENGLNVHMLNHENGDLKLGTNDAEKMRITSAGVVCIGTDTANANGDTLTIAKGSGDLVSLSRTGTGNSRVLSIQSGRATGSTTANMIVFDNGSGSAVGTIQSNNSSTSFNTSSDYRLKENAVAISDGITRLKTLKPYRFNWKVDSTTTVDGFFAHEVTAVPEAVTGTKDEVITQEMIDNDNAPKGSVGDPIYQGIDQSKLVPLLTAALQEAIAKIETLETEVAALKGS